MRASSLAVLLGLAGCAEPQYDPESPWEEGALGEIRAGMTVAEAGGCSTAIVRPLSEQLIEEINCLRPGTLASFEHPDIEPSAVVFTSLQTAARNGLIAAVQARGSTMRMNSALRTLPQGYLLYRWWQEGRCGIALAARPGRSRHESGLAIDIEDHGGWQGALEGNGWRWFGNDDRVHFDFVAAGAVDLAGLSVLAFQRLWNRNNRADVIDEDGLYGPQTEARLRQSPVAGFPIGACQPDAPEPEPEPAPMPEAQPEPIPEAQPEPEPAPMPEPVPEAQPEPAPQPVPRPEPEPVEPEPGEPEPAPQPEPIPEAQPVPEPAPPPSMDMGVDPLRLDSGIRDRDQGIASDGGRTAQIPPAPTRFVGGCQVWW